MSEARFGKSYFWDMSDALSNRRKRWNTSNIYYNVARLVKEAMEASISTAFSSFFPTLLKQKE